MKPYLDRLLAEFDVTAALARDPIRFPRRYEDPADVEVAAVFSAMLAFGRVDLFAAVLERIFAQADARGGPARWVRTFGPDDAQLLAPIVYRWNRGPDFVLLARTLQAAGPVGPLFSGPDPLVAGLTRLRALAPGSTRGFRTWLVDPRQGSACKRWRMLLRWMVRRDHVDLGLWTHLSPADLVIPLDTHVHRVARFLGMTRRATADARSALEVTAALRRLDPRDPVKYDFALAHLGISRACLGHRHPDVCPGCPLDPICQA